MAVTCPHCGSTYTKFLSEKEDFNKITKKYSCLSCQKSFETSIKKADASYGDKLIIKCIGLEDKFAEICINKKGQVVIKQNDPSVESVRARCATRIMLPKFKVSKFIGKYYLEFNSFKYFNDDMGTLFNVHRLELDDELAKNALANEAMRIAWNGKYFNMEKLKGSEFAVRDAASWLSSAILEAQQAAQKEIQESNAKKAASLKKTNSISADERSLIAAALSGNCPKCKSANVTLVSASESRNTSNNQYTCADCGHSFSIRVPQGSPDVDGTLLMKFFDNYQHYVEIYRNSQGRLFARHELGFKNFDETIELKHGIKLKVCGSYLSSQLLITFGNEEFSVSKLLLNEDLRKVAAKSKAMQNVWNGKEFEFTQFEADALTDASAWLKKAINSPSSFGQKATGAAKMRYFKKKFKTVAICVAIVFVAAFAIIGIPAIDDASYNDYLINNALEYINKEREKMGTVDYANEYIIEYIEEAKAVYSDAGAVELIFMNSTDKIETLFDEYNAFWSKKVSQLCSDIDKLSEKEVKFTREFESELESLEEAYSLIPESFRDDVTNYDTLSQIDDDFEDRKELFSTSSRHKCGYCGGNGKNVITWYEHGDWGEKSYSSYSCKYCGGTGEIISVRYQYED